MRSVSAFQKRWIHTELAVPSWDPAVPKPLATFPPPMPWAVTGPTSKVSRAPLTSNKPWTEPVDGETCDSVIDRIPFEAPAADHVPVNVALEYVLSVISMLYVESELKVALTIAAFMVAVSPTATSEPVEIHVPTISSLRLGPIAPSELQAAVKATTAMAMGKRRDVMAGLLYVVRFEKGMSCSR
jgi:hypothetical protein